MCELRARNGMRYDRLWLVRKHDFDEMSDRPTKRNTCNCQQSALPWTLCLIGSGGQLDHTRQNYLTRSTGWASKKHISNWQLMYQLHTSSIRQICTGYTRKSCHTTHNIALWSQWDYAPATRNLPSILWQFPKFRMPGLACANAIARAWAHRSNNRTW